MASRSFRRLLAGPLAGLLAGILITVAACYGPNAPPGVEYEPITGPADEAPPAGDPEDTGADDGITRGTPEETGTISPTGTSITYTITGPSVTEGNSGQTDMVFTITASAAPAEAVTFTVTTAACGTTDAATAGTDYTALGFIQVQFDATTTVQTVTVKIHGDTDAEPNESVCVTMTRGTDTVTVAGTIIDDDQPGTGTGTGGQPGGDDPGGEAGGQPVEDTEQRVRVGNGTAVERTGVMYVDIVLLYPVETVTVKYAVAGCVIPDGWRGPVKATRNQDFTNPATTTMTLSPTQTTGVVAIPLIDDDQPEAYEGVCVQILTARNAAGDSVRVSRRVGYGGIVDEDVLSITVENVEVTEDGARATLAPTLSHLYHEPVTIVWHTFAVTAHDTSDFLPVTTGTVTIAAGELDEDIQIALVNDTTVEKEEYLHVGMRARIPRRGERPEVQKFDGVKIAATGRFVDGFKVPTVFIEDDDAAVLSGANGAGKITLRLSAPVVVDVQVPWCATFSGEHPLVEGTWTVPALSQSVDVQVSPWATGAERALAYLGKHIKTTSSTDPNGNPLTTTSCTKDAPVTADGLSVTSGTPALATQTGAGA